MFYLLGVFMYGFVLVVRMVNWLIKIVFYTIFNIFMLYLSSFILDGEIPEVGSKIYISVGAAFICTFISFFDSMGKFIDAYLRIRSK